jgi:hypothetical protein
MAKIDVSQVYDELALEYGDVKVKGRKTKNRKKKLKKFKEEKAK